MNPWFQLEMAREREREARRLASATTRGRARPRRRPRPKAHLVRHTGLLMMRVGARLAGPGEPAPLFAPRLPRTS
jgi:hypothetical protein